MKPRAKHSASIKLRVNRRNNVFLKKKQYFFTAMWCLGPVEGPHVKIWHNQIFSKFLCFSKNLAWFWKIFNGSLIIDLSGKVNTTFFVPFTTVEPLTWLDLFQLLWLLRYLQFLETRIFEIFSKSAKVRTVAKVRLDSPWPARRFTKSRNFPYKASFASKKIKRQISKKSLGETPGTIFQKQTFGFFNPHLAK